MRTAIYVDGFNLYYGALKGAPPGYRWLDLYELAKAALQPHHNITSIHYCTALVRPTSGNDQSPDRQQIYIKALEAHLSMCRIHYGHFLRHQATAPNVNPPPNLVDYVKTEEKGSDVNLASRLLADAFQDAYDCAIVVSNDGDMAPAVQIARQEAGKMVGALMPRQHPNRHHMRRASAELKAECNFVRTIFSRTIRRCQLPSPIPNTEYYKPQHW